MRVWGSSEKFDSAKGGDWIAWVAHFEQVACNRITRLHTVSTTPTARSQPSLSNSLHTQTRQSRLISKISVEDEATRNQLKNYNDDQDSKGASTKTRWLYLLDTITTAYLPTIEYRHSNRKKCRKTAVRR